MHKALILIRSRCRGYNGFWKVSCFKWFKRDLVPCPKTGFTTQGSFRSHAHTYVRPMRTKEARDESALTLSLGELYTFGQVATWKEYMVKRPGWHLRIVLFEKSLSRVHGSGANASHMRWSSVESGRMLARADTVTNDRSYGFGSGYLI